VQGEINISNATIEDFIILRKDGSPTYQLSAVVDDHDMQITHVIRGDDHKINTFKQKQIYESMQWKAPLFAHIPLIHSKEGKKLSKRDNASTLLDYIKIGILPEALRNYLLRLGWSYKDKEIFTLNESIEHFNLTGVGKSPSKLDMERILSINEHYIKNLNENELFKNLKKFAEKYKKKIDEKYDESLLKSIHFLKNKAKKLEDIYQNAQYIINENITISEEDSKLLDIVSKKVIKDFLQKYEKMDKLEKISLETIIKSLITSNNTNFKGVGQPLRIALTGSKFGPGIYDVILSLDKNRVIKRLKMIN
jgi:glutamyl-tRNA synthetase